MISESPVRRSLFNALLDITPQCGWMLPAILAECDVRNDTKRKDEIILLCDNNADKLIILFMAEVDKMCASQLKDTNVNGITHTMHLLLVGRYTFFSHHPQAFEALFSHLQKITNIRLGKTIMTQTADNFWRTCGDRSTDTNYYTKRGLLMYVLGATTLSWVRGMRTAEQIDAEIAQNLKRVLRLGRLKENLHQRAAPLLSSARDFLTRFFLKP